MKRISKNAMRLFMISCFFPGPIVHRLRFAESYIQRDTHPDNNYDSHGCTYCEMQQQQQQPFFSARGLPFFLDQTTLMDHLSYSPPPTPLPFRSYRLL